MSKPLLAMICQKIALLFIRVCVFNCYVTVISCTVLIFLPQRTFGSVLREVVYQVCLLLTRWDAIVLALVINRNREAKEHLIFFDKLALAHPGCFGTNAIKYACCFLLLSVFTCESSYCFQHVLAIAILSVCHTVGSVKNGAN